jgi:aspartate 1-decarboxylase
MELTMLKGKIHRATVTDANINYNGSITIDQDLMEAAGILEYEQVQVVDINNGSRLETYVIAGERGSKVMCLNGAAARLVQVGDRIIVLCYAQMTPQEAAVFKPRLVLLGDDNTIAQII